MEYKPHSSKCKAGVQVFVLIKKIKHEFNTLEINISPIDSP